jgi:hypothetical protein
MFAIGRSGFEWLESLSPDRFSKKKIEIHFSTRTEYSSAQLCNACIDSEFQNKCNTFERCPRQEMIYCRLQNIIVNWAPWGEEGKVNHANSAGCCNWFTSPPKEKKRDRKRKKGRRKNTLAISSQPLHLVAAACREMQRNLSRYPYPSTSVTLRNKPRWLNVELIKKQRVNSEKWKTSLNSGLEVLLESSVL